MNTAHSLKPLLAHMHGGEQYPQFLNISAKDGHLIFTIRDHAEQHTHENGSYLDAGATVSYTVEVNQIADELLDLAAYAIKEEVGSIADELRDPIAMEHTVIERIGAIEVVHTERIYEGARTGRWENGSNKQFEERRVAQCAAPCSNVDMSLEGNTSDLADHNEYDEAKAAHAYGAPLLEEIFVGESHPPVMRPGEWGCAAMSDDGHQGLIIEQAFGEPARTQVARLAQVIMALFEEPSEDEGAVDCAIRILRRVAREKRDIQSGVQQIKNSVDRLPQLRVPSKTLGSIQDGLRLGTAEKPKSGESEKSFLDFAGRSVQFKE